MLKLTLKSHASKPLKVIQVVTKKQLQERKKLLLRKSQLKK